MRNEFKVDELAVKVFPDRKALGNAVAEMVGNRIVDLLLHQEFANVIFAAAPSQNEFLAALIARNDIDWSRVNAFHMDEYIGLSPNAPQRFAAFLKDKLFDHLPFRAINYINGNAEDAAGECNRYAALLTEFPPDIVCMGIGENGHIAFNDPHVADFNDLFKVKIVDLDQACRQQQVNDGCFYSLQEVPTHAMTLTVPALMSGRFIYCIVPGKNKAQAVLHTLKDAINEHCPASVLRRHLNAVLYLDSESSPMIKS